MNKKLFLVSVVTLLLGTTSVMADNHKHHDGPQKPKKEVVQKQNKKDNKKDKHGKSCHHCHKSHCNHRGHCRPVAPRRPIKNHVRITPPFSPIQVTVRI